MSTAPAQFAFVPADRVAAAARLAADLDASQLAWLSGYFAGLAAPRETKGAAVPAILAPKGAVAERPSLTILSASHTGNGRKIAERLLASARQAGVTARLVRAADYAPRELAREKLLYVVVSTHGEGDPPEEARALFEFLSSKRAPQLAGLQYAVLALGDSSYAKFCAAGRFIDERFAKLGARRLLPRVDCDVDVERLARPWLDDALARVSEHADRSVTDERALDGESSVAILGLGGRSLASPDASAPIFDRTQPARAEIILNQRVTSRDALREVRHIELGLGSAQMRYEPGDALGIVHRNPPSAVEALLNATRLHGDEPVAHAGRTRALHEWLRDDLEITRVARPLVASIADRGNAEAREWLSPEASQRLADLMHRSQVADIVTRFGTEWTAADLVATLRPVASRLYSIASSQAAVGDEVHITVAMVGSDSANIASGPRAVGAASSFLAGQDIDASIGVWLERNDRFRLPTDDSRDIIMVGPGTGVAPFRAFVQEREQRGASGRNWLFFGSRTLRDDFLYQLEWQAALKRSTLHRLDAAFSRDQADKIYVQHRMRERGRELFAWLASGAYFYVCGDATHMAPDVHTALIDIVAEHGGLTPDDARDWVSDLTADGRYLRDVY